VDRPFLGGVAEPGEGVSARKLLAVGAFSEHYYVNGFTE
jgi:hypothetical protein